MEITRYLDSSKIIKSYKILNFKTFENGFYIKISVELTDASELFLTEYLDETERIK